MEELQNIIDKYEVPKQYFDALWDAYEAGHKRGFISGSIDVFNREVAPQRAERDL
jgi:hypothetical protein